MQHSLLMRLLRSLWPSLHWPHSLAADTAWPWAHQVNWEEEASALAGEEVDTNSNEAAAAHWWALALRPSRARRRPSLRSALPQRPPHPRLVVGDASGCLLLQLHSNSSRKCSMAALSHDRRRSSELHGRGRARWSGWRLQPLRLRLG